MRIAKELLQIIMFLPLIRLLNIASLKKNAHKMSIFTSLIGKRKMDVNVCTRILTLLILLMFLKLVILLAQVHGVIW